MYGSRRCLELSIGGYRASVPCAEWASLGLPSGAAGVVLYQYNPSTGTIVWTEDIAHVREAQCGVLQRFGESAQKPTRCATTRTVTRTVYERVKVPKRVWYWKKVRLKNGHTKRVRKSKWPTDNAPPAVTAPPVARDLMRIEERELEAGWAERAG
jgi:hypothetical protein